MWKKSPLPPVASSELLNVIVRTQQKKSEKNNHSKKSVAMKNETKTRTWYHDWNY